MSAPISGRPEDHGGFTGDLWRSIIPIYTAILHHPFLRGLTDGSLSADRFRHYVLQDALYLRDYARALAYTSYLLRTASLGDYAEVLGAVLPCYWIYAEVGKTLLERGSPNPTS